MTSFSTRTEDLRCFTMETTRISLKNVRGISIVARIHSARLFTFSLATYHFCKRNKIS